MSQDYSPALWMPTSHYWNGYGGYGPRWIILHGTAGGSSAQNIAQFFQNNNPPTSTHYVVGQDGTVVQCVLESNAAWGNGILSAGHDPWWSDSINPNLQTISIEHVKPAIDNSTLITSAQQAASFALVEHLCKTHNIAARAADSNGGITGHFSIDPVNRARCPGPYPWDALWSYLGGGGTSMGVPAGWHDDGTTLTAPNGHKAVLGFRSYILSNSWDANNWPIEDQVHVSDLLAQDSRWGEGDRQLCRATMLAYPDNPQGGVVPAKSIWDIGLGMGNEVQALWGRVGASQQQLSQMNAELTAANQQITQLKQQIAQLQSGSGGGSGSPSGPAADALTALQAIKKVLGEI